MQCYNVAAQITPGVCAIHEIVDKPFDKPTCRS
jgi:hypothetical protein